MYNTTSLDGCRRLALQCSAADSAVRSALIPGSLVPMRLRNEASFWVDEINNVDIIMIIS